MKHLVIALVVTLCAIPAIAEGSRFNVNCDKGERINKLLHMIAQAGAQPPVTVNVSGTCKESVSIQNFDRLTLITKTGAVIIGPSKDVNAAVTISNSSFITLQGFLIQNGMNGVLCDENSVCNLAGLTVEKATYEGVRFERSGGVLSGNVFQNNGYRGLSVVNGSKVLVSGGTIQGNADAGIGVLSGSELNIEGATIQNNALDGVLALLGSSVRIYDSTISGNGGSGIGLYSQSNGSLEQTVTGNVVTGNAGNGVFLRDLSFARFVGTNNVSANLTQPDVTCVPQFPATRGSGTVGGTTNCVEPRAAKEGRDWDAR
jgi:parallel beta-helix repeat protein